VVPGYIQFTRPRGQVREAEVPNGERCVQFGDNTNATVITEFPIFDKEKV
jgi:hypothetical protein